MGVMTEGTLLSDILPVNRQEAEVPLPLSEVVEVALGVIRYGLSSSAIFF